MFHTALGVSASLAYVILSYQRRMASFNPVRMFKTMAEIELTGMRPRDPDRPILDSSHEGLLSAENPDAGLSNGNGHLPPESEAFLGGPLEKPASVSVFKKTRKNWWILLVIIFIVAALVVIIFVATFFSVSEESAIKPTWLNSTVVNTSLVGPPVDIVPKPEPELHIQQFQSFVDSGNSKLFQVTFSNGTIIRTFGPKGIDGSSHSLYSISIGDATGSDLTYIHFKGRNNFASVMLPQGTIVTYDWNNGFKSLECKIFSVSKSSDPMSEPLSHIYTLPLGEYSEIFVRISKGIIKPHVQARTNVSKEECNSRLPLLVTKCGSQYTYQGAFLQGVLTPDEGASVMMEALPWPTTQDNCNGDRSITPNYYLPLPVITNISSEIMKETFCSTGTTVFKNLCLSIEGSISDLDIDMCTSIASSVKGERGNVYEHVYNSCFKIFHSIRLACTSLKASSTSDISTNEFHVTQTEIYRSLCKNTSRTSDLLQGPRMFVDVRAFCPSVQPLTSYRQLINLNQSNLGSFENLIHIMCPNSPEVTRYVLGHKYIGQSSTSPKLDHIEHMLDICSTCAAGTVMEVTVSRDQICCRNNCSRSDMCEISEDLSHTERAEFTENIHCHHFLRDYINKMHEDMETRCISGCNMDFSVEFKLYNKDTTQLFYKQTLTCNQENSFSCKRTFGR